MSNITGNVHYARQNVENSNPISDDIDSINQILTGIGYVALSDTTTINNNVVIGATKSLTVDGVNVKESIEQNETDIAANTTDKRVVQRGGHDHR